MSGGVMTAPSSPSPIKVLRSNPVQGDTARHRVLQPRPGRRGARGLHNVHVHDVTFQNAPGWRFSHMTATESGWRGCGRDAQTVALPQTRTFYTWQPAGGSCGVRGRWSRRRRPERALAVWRWRGCGGRANGSGLNITNSDSAPRGDQCRCCANADGTTWRNTFARPVFRAGDRVLVWCRQWPQCSDRVCRGQRGVGRPCWGESNARERARFGVAHARRQACQCQYTATICTEGRVRGGTH